MLQEKYVWSGNDAGDCQDFPKIGECVIGEGNGRNDIKPLVSIDPAPLFSYSISRRPATFSEMILWKMKE